MTTLGKTRITPNISLRLASKSVKFHLQANMDFLFARAGLEPALPILPMFAWKVRNMRNRGEQ